jgi:crotonobetainyl-CoA:carnitine CoA-transferase CaiB-like acyl-CoA transferase
VQPDAYRCRPDPDGRKTYVLIDGTGDGIFRRLKTAIGRHDLGRDPELAHNEGRDRRAQELDAGIEALTPQRSVVEVIQTLDAADVPVGEIYSVADIAHDPQYHARGMIVQTTDQPLHSAQANKKPAGGSQRVRKVVARDGFEPPTFGL